MIYIYLLILFILLALIISFRNYKSKCYKMFPKKEAPLIFLYGFSMLLYDGFSRILKSRNTQSTEDLKEKLKIISLGVATFTILIVFGFLTCIDVPKKASQEEKETVEEGSITLTEEATTNLDKSFEKYEHVKDAISLFEKYREDIENEFLGDNNNFLSIDKPLNLLSQYGDEPILITWTFETENVVNEDGTFNYANISDEGCQTMAYANLSFGETKATLSIPIFICPPK